MKKQLILTLFALLSVFSARAYEFVRDGICYCIRSGTTDEVWVARHDNSTIYSGSVVIPETVTYGDETYRVTSIGVGAFYKCSGLTSVTIPNSVTSIRDEAFYGCSGLTSVEIPNSVTSIGYEAFYNCSGLTSLTLPESVTAIGVLAFYGTAISSPLYNSKVFAYMPTDYSGAYEIPDGIRSIADAAFWECIGLTLVEIPNSVDSIGSSAFRGCSGLTSVTIPESVTSIGDYAFSGCSGLTSVFYGGDIAQWCGMKVRTRIGDYNSDGWDLYINNEKVADLVIPNSVTSIRWYTFAGCSGLTSVTIPNSVTSIWGDAFRGCSGLTSVTIGEGVTSIGESAFGRCSGLTSLTIPNSVTAIEKHAFSGCSGLTSVTIGEGVTSIGDYAFAGCSGLTSVTIPEGVTSIAREAFYGCSGLTSVEWNAKHCSDFRFSYDGITSPFSENTALTSFTFGEKVEYIPNYLCYGCSGLTSVEIPNSVDSIGSSAFRGCSGLTSVTIPESVTSIGGYAFAGCSGLTSVTIPESVTSIGDEAFYNCSGLRSVEWNAKHCSDFTSYYSPFSNNTSLTSITFGDKVEHIPSYLCDGCSGLTSLIIPNSVTDIGTSAFEECSGLTSVTIGEGVTAIGSSAFRGCSGLTSVIWNAKHCSDFSSSSNSSPFYNKTTLTSITFGDKVEYIPSCLCNGCSGLTSLIIPNSVTSIGSYAFSGCSGLTSVTIPEGVTTIYESSFSGCSGLTSLTIPNSVTAIEKNAFNRCTGLTSITIGEGVTSIGEKAFYDCRNLLSVISLAEIPPVCEIENVFSNDHRPTEYYQTLYVPRGCKAAYQEAPEWRYFTKIRESGMILVTVKPNYETMGTVTGGGEYEADKQAVLTAIPNQGYHFEKWDDDNTDNPRILTVTEDITLTAIFAKNPDAPVYYTVTLRVNDAAMGSVLGGGQYARDDQATLVAIPNLGYHFVRWDDGNTANPRTLTVTGDITLTAIFAKNDPTSNEAALSAAPFAYVQGRTAYLSDGLGEVEALTATGQRVYRGFDRSIALPRPGVYILRVVADGRRCKVIVK